MPVSVLLRKPRLYKFEEKQPFVQFDAVISLEPASFAWTVTLLSARISATHLLLPGDRFQNGRVMSGAIQPSDRVRTAILAEIMRQGWPQMFPQVAWPRVGEKNVV